MIRLITHILDIKNLLGKAAPVPIPAYPPNECVFRGNGEDIIFTPTFSGSVEVYYMVDGVEQYYIYTDSGEPQLIQPDADTDVRIVGNLTRLEIGDYLGLLAINSNMATLNIRSDAHIGILDFRNSSGSTRGSWAGVTTDVSVIYASGVGIDVAVLEESIINNSIYSNGTLWINPADRYALRIINAARNKGWTIYEL